MIGGSPHIEEVSVHPDHGRRGLGRRLVETALAWARTAGHLRITLTTFRELIPNPAYGGPLTRVLMVRELT
jgi:GNAT superfamily N-acetyltransferase